MHARDAVRDFLVSRRARITPQQVGLPGGGARRRVAGLRREEVAVLAGVSTEWYTRLEKGHIGEVSLEVIDAVARALRLDPTEQAYLHGLAQATRRPDLSGTAPVALPASVQRVLASVNDVPAIVFNGRLEILATNVLGRALYAPVFASGGAQPSIARFSFLDGGAARLLPDLDTAQGMTVAMLRTELALRPADSALRVLLRDLKHGSAVFRSIWERQDVEVHRTGTKRFNVADIGTIELAFDSLTLAAAPGLTMTAFTPEPGSDSADRIRLLASLTATLAQDEPAAATIAR